MKKTPATQRMDKYVNRADHDGCWLWTGAIDRYGYGCIWDHTPDGRGRMKSAHRVAWERLHGMEPPRHLCIMHLCDVRHCVNPDHLLAGTVASNQLDMALKGRGYNGNGMGKKTHCPQGHPYDESNTYVGSKGERHCRVCGREASRRYRARRAA